MKAYIIVLKVTDDEKEGEVDTQEILTEIKKVDISGVDVEILSCTGVQARINIRNHTDLSRRESKKQNEN